MEVGGLILHALARQRFLLMCVLLGLGWARTGSCQGVDALEDDPWYLLWVGAESLTDSLFQDASNYLLECTNDADFSAQAVQRMQWAEAVVVYGVAKGRKSALFPELLLGFEEVMRGGALRSFIWGYALYKTGDPGAAIHHLREAWASVGPTSQVYYMASINLSACYNELSDGAQAIAVLEEALSKEVAEQAEGATYDWVEVYRQQILINLIGLRISSFDYARALEAIALVDTAQLDAYWQSVLHRNEMLAYRGVRDFERRDSIWHAHVQHIPFEELERKYYKYFLHQILLSKDYVQFKQFRSFLLDQDAVRELGEAEGFAALWEEDPVAEEQLFAAFSRYAGWAEEEDAYQLYRAQEEVQIAQDRLGAMEQKLLDAQEKNERFTFWYLALIALVVLGAIGVYLGQQLRKKQRTRVIERGLQAEGDELQNLPLEITRADIRVIGEAISQGRHIQDALLVMKKMSSMLDLASEESHPLKDLPRIPGIASLTDRELQVLQHIASGFEAKEISRSLDMAPEYVYNIRSRVRRKLNIPSSDTFEDWLARFGRE